MDEELRAMYNKNKEAMKQIEKGIQFLKSVPTSRVCPTSSAHTITQYTALPIPARASSRD